MRWQCWPDNVQRRTGRARLRMEFLLRQRVSGDGCHWQHPVRDGLRAGSRVAQMKLNTVGGRTRGCHFPPFELAEALADQNPRAAGRIRRISTQLVYQLFHSRREFDLDLA